MKTIKRLVKCAAPAILWCGLLVVASASAQPLSGSVVEIADGDSISVRTNEVPQGLVIKSGQTLRHIKYKMSAPAPCTGKFRMVLSSQWGARIQRPRAT